MPLPFKSLVLTSGLAFLTSASFFASEPPIWPTQTISLWHKEGKDGLACSSCHSPSGREVWDSGISLDDVKRRALNHLPEADAIGLAEAVEYVRSTLHVTTTHLRPFAPDQLEIAGSTEIERDNRFGLHVKEIASHLVLGEVWTLEQADSASRELTGKPLSGVTPGFVLDPVSRDPFRTLDGPALGDWIPDVGLSQKGTDAFESACSKFHSPDGTYDVPAIDDAVVKVEGRPSTAMLQLSRLKRLALLHYCSLLETGHRPAPVKLSPAMPEDPIWAVANFFRLNQGNTPEMLGIEKSDAIRMGLVPTKAIDFNQSALSWMWVSWTLDPSLQATSLDRQARNGRYMMKMFFDAGPYVWHAAYFAARRPLEQRLIAPETQSFQPEINSFVNEAALETNLPKDSESQAAFVRFCSNLLRMDCLILERDLRAGRKLTSVVSARQQLGALWKFVQTRMDDASREKTGRIVDRTTELIGQP